MARAKKILTGVFLSSLFLVVPLIFGGCGCGGSAKDEAEAAEPAESPPPDSDEDGTSDASDTDDDDDGVADADDAFPLDVSETVDTDGDGVGDSTDTDDDGDGVADASDAFPLLASESVDTDGDGTGNVADTDDDGDGIADASDAFPLDSAETTDTDGDGTGNVADTDDDGDGVADASDAFPLLASESVDTDGDGIGNVADTDDDGDGVADASDAFPLLASESVDTDGDGIGNVADTDDDGDGVADASDAFPLDSAESVDTDGDGIGNKADTDDDNDTVVDASDNCPLVSNADQMNTDGAADGGDACDADDDNDTVADASDNCPLVSNADQANLDSDSLGDVCDTDMNDNGIADASGSDPETDQLTYWAATDGTAMASGAIDDPMDLATALATADDDSALLRNVYLVDGTYLQAAALALSEGVSLYGGFGALVDGTRVRDLTPLATTISGAADASVIVSPAGITSATVVDGFVITGGDSAAGSAVAIGILNSSPTISNNDITSGGGAINAIAIDIVADTGGTASPLIEDNQSIEAGAATAVASLGISITAAGGGTASPTIRDNLAIRGGAAGDESFGVRLLELDTDPATEGSATIEGNTIEAQVTSMGDVAVGIALGFGTDGFDSATVSKNNITGGWGSVTAIGLSITMAESSTTVTNNIITGVVDPATHAGAGEGSVVGVFFEGGGTAVSFTNNTVNTGPAPATVDTLIAILVDDDGSGDPSAPDLVNNIIHSSSAGSSLGIVEGCLACDPTSLENQLFSGTLVVYYIDEEVDPTSDMPTINSFLGALDNIEGDPAFITEDMFSVSYLRIGATSDAIDAGRTVVSITDDIDGDARPGGAAYDIGADERP